MSKAETTKQMNNPPAFPYTEHTIFQESRESETKFIAGMTLRDYFAAKAINGMIASMVKLAEVGGEIRTNKDLAKGAYEIADAMLKARE